MPKKESFEDRVKRHTEGLTSINSGLCGSCSECRSDFNMKVESTDVVIKEDGMYLLDECIMTLDELRVEYERCDAEWVLDEDVADCFRQELGYLDIDEDLLTKLFNEKISNQDYLDEGSFSSHGCDTCGCPLGNTLYNAHGFGEGMQIIHLSICPDCVQLFANGELPAEEDDESDCGCGDEDYEGIVKESGLIWVTEEKSSGWIDYHLTSKPEDTRSMQSTCCDWYDLAVELELA